MILRTDIWRMQKISKAAIQQKTAAQTDELTQQG
jgi:hypothetical protein